MSLAICHSVSDHLDNVYWPASGPIRGGVVCLHGSDGGFAGWNDVNCALLAAHGFVALAHNYTRRQKLWTSIPDIDHAPLDGTAAALSFLRGELAPRGCGVGLFGYSRGAEHAMLVAQLMTEDGDAAAPRAVAAHSPPDEAWPAFMVADFDTGQPWAGDRNRSAWTWRGAEGRVRPGTPIGMALCPYPVLITQGTEDQVWSADMARSLVARMAAAGTPAEAHFFEGEGHLFRAEARNRQWTLIVDFFGRHLAPSVKPEESSSGPP